MAFNDTIKGINIAYYVAAIERRPVGAGYEQVEHIFVTTKTGNVIDIQPQKGIVKTVCRNTGNEVAPKVTYAWGNNRFYIGDGGGTDKNETIYEYDPVNAKVTKVFDAQQYLPQFANLFQETGFWGNWYNQSISTDGHAYGAAFRNNAVPAIWRINSSTSEVDIFHQNPDFKTEVIQGLQYSLAFHYTGAVTALQGVYSTWRSDDDFTQLFDTVISEATSVGVTFKPDSRLFALHTDDRAVGSITRRVSAFTNISGVDSPGVYVERLVDLKDVAERTTNMSGGAYALMSTLSGTTGINVPAFNLGLFYTNESRQVGRFMYAAYYRASFPNYYGFAYALQDYPSQGVEAGQMIFPTNQIWDRESDLPDYAGYNAGIYKCNFGGAFGFSSSDEPVMFIYSYADGTTKGFIRPDNLEFYTYDPVADPNGYVISTINNLTEFGCDIAQGLGPVQYGGESVITSSILESSVLEDIQSIVDPDFNVADAIFSFHPHKDYTLVRSGRATGLSASAGIIAGVIELAANQLAIGGINYTGVAVKTRSGSTLSDVDFYNNVNSIYSVLRFDSSTSLWFGYDAQIFKVTSAPSGAVISGIPIKYTLYGNALNSTYAIVSGRSIRVENYYEGYAYVAYLNPATNSNALLPNLPNKLNPLSGKVFRELIGLESESYSDNDAMDAAISYANANSLTLQDVIDMALDTCLYAAYDPVCWGGSKCLIGLRVNELSGLVGIRLNDEADQTGTWYDENYYLSTEYPAAYYFDKADPTSLIESDYKTIKFEVSGFQGVDTLGRLAASDDYVAFLKNDSTSGNAVIRVVAKTDIESAASTGNPINAFARTINIALGSTSTEYGFGAGNGTFGLLGNFTRPNNFFFSIGNKLYVSVITAVTDGGSKPAIYEVDLATGTTTIYARLNSDAAKTINYNPDSDVCFLCAGTSFYAIDNFSGITTPYDIT